MYTLFLKNRGFLNHLFCNLKKGVRFVSPEHWIWDMGFLSEDYGIIVPKASVIVQVRQL